MLQSWQLQAAAHDAHIVQSAMSSAIARLERDLGAQLFDGSVMPAALQSVGGGSMDIAPIASAAKHVAY